MSIRNIYSFKKAEVDFGNENIITGYNGSGKSNIFRILKLLIQNTSYGFSTCYLEDSCKFNAKAESGIRIRLRFSDLERKLISGLLFRKDIKKLKKIDLIIVWDGLRQNQKIRNLIIINSHTIISENDSRLYLNYIIERKKDVFSISRDIG
jgi:AAA15 family ATPase/GTPase